MPVIVSNPAEPLRGGAAHLAGELQVGRVYRREDLARLSAAVDRHLRELVATGKLSKLGLYAQIHENFRVPSFLSVPASSDRLGAARRRGRDAGKGSGG